MVATLVELDTETEKNCLFQTKKWKNWKKKRLNKTTTRPISIKYGKNMCWMIDFVPASTEKYRYLDTGNH